MGYFISPDDLTPFASIDTAKAVAMIEDAEAMAVLAAPCLLDAPSAEKIAAAKAILRGAILRWHDAGTGVVQQTQVGPFGQSLDTRQVRKGMFWPSEIEQLQQLCRAAPAGGAFEVDTAPIGSTDGYWSAPDAWTPLP